MTKVTIDFVSINSLGLKVANKEFSEPRRLLTSLAEN